MKCKLCEGSVLILLTRCVALCWVYRRCSGNIYQEEGREGRKVRRREGGREKSREGKNLALIASDLDNYC